MREIKLPLNQTQKLRLQRALDKLDSLSTKANANTVVAVGDAILVNLEDAILKGHGTAELDGQLVAMTDGVIERVNKLVYVQSLKSKYKYGLDDANLRLEILWLGVSLSLQHDGTIQLQARSEKYGKLESGQLLKVPAYLIRRRKHHFHNLEEHEVTLVIGCNGFIWVGERIDAKDNMMEDGEECGILADSTSHEDGAQTPLETREVICRIANAVRVLSNLGFSITEDVIMNLVDLSSKRNVDVHDMLAPEFNVLAAEAEAERRQKNKRV